MVEYQKWRKGTKVGKSEKRLADTSSTDCTDCIGYHLISNI